MQTSSPAPLSTQESRGIHCELFHDHLIYYFVTSRGERLPGVRVPIGLETVADVIADLWAEGNRRDPLPSAAASGPPRTACHCEPRLRLVGP